jgi:hypothetical protein
MFDVCCSNVIWLDRYDRSFNRQKKQENNSDILIKFDLSNAVAAAGVYNLLKMSIPFPRFSCATTSHMAENLRKERNKLRGRKSGWGVREFQPSESTTGRINRLLLCVPAFVVSMSGVLHTHTRW